MRQLVDCLVFDVLMVPMRRLWRAIAILVLAGCGDDEGSSSGTADGSDAGSGTATASSSTTATGSTSSDEATGSSVSSASDASTTDPGETTTTDTSGTGTDSDATGSATASTGEGTGSTGSTGSTGTGAVFPVDCDDGEPPVRIEGAGAYDTIQTAVSSAVSGATIYVCPGIYQEAVHLERDVHIVGAGPDLVTVDGGGVGYLFEATNLDLTIESMTIRAGRRGIHVEWDDGNGGQLEVHDVVLADHEIEGLHAEAQAEVDEHTVIVTGTTVTGSYGSNGSGVFLRAVTATLTDCIIEDNVGPSGAGLMIVGAIVSVTGGSVRRNHSDAWGGARLVTSAGVVATLDISGSDWGTGQAQDNTPTDVFCYDTGSPAGFLGENATYTCAADQDSCCSE